MDIFTLQNPVFQTYVIAAALMCLKALAQGWMTVQRMIAAKGGFLNEEDTRRTFSNPEPHPGQLDRNEHVERSRRMHGNDTENIPVFLGAGLIFTAAAPPLLLAQCLMYGFVAARLAHFWAYLTQQNHEVRAAFFSIGSLITIFMAGYALIAAVF